MKIGRNEPCPCGSGKKYKLCHFGRALPEPQQLTLLERNRALTYAAAEIFGFTRGVDWRDLKRSISDKQVREFYEFQAILCDPAHLKWENLVPAPDGSLRALYLGDIYPSEIERNIVRFGLYADELLIVDPFHNPWVLKPEFNPIDNPHQFKADTIKLLWFLASMEAWIQAGIVRLIPDPSDYLPGLRTQSWKSAKERLRGKGPTADDYARGQEQGRQDFKRSIFSLPEDAFIRAMEKAGAVLDEKTRQAMLDLRRRELDSDPIAIEGGLERGGQLINMRSGGNLEIAMFVAQATGAFPYTNIPFRWRELTDARDQMTETAKIWSPLTQAFQQLDFRFLDNVQVSFANEIRRDGRLSAFRSFLRKMSNDAARLDTHDAMESFVRDRKDELVGEYKKAQAEWQKIDEDFFKWAGAATSSALVAGHFVPHVTVGAAAAVGANLITRYMRQLRFRKANPMSVFVDLEGVVPKGGTILI
jgi:hypothetical protein